MYVIRGETYPIRQCLKEDKMIEVETVNMDAEKESAMDRMKRFIPGLRVRKYLNLYVTHYSSFTES